MPRRSDGSRVRERVRLYLDHLQRRLREQLHVLPMTGGPLLAFTRRMNLKKTMANLDVADLIRKQPLPVLAAASTVGLILGVTIGSKAVRMLVSSVGMFTLTEIARRYAQSALDDFASPSGKAPQDGVRRSAKANHTPAHV
jgi:hypothetical protein